MLAALTGATGFVGGHLLQALQARGARVRCLCRDPAAARRLQDAGAEVVLGSLADRAALARLAAGADVVYHVAGAIAAPSLAAFLEVNEAGTARVALAAREAAVGRLVYVSSLAATGPSADGRALAEGEGPGPVSDYGRSKRAGEEAARAAGVAVTIVRPPVVYGPGDRQTLRLFRMARAGLAVLPGDGRQRLSLVHARDLAEAILAAGEAAATIGRTYHAGHPDVLSQRDLAAALGRAVGRRVRVLTVPGPAVRAVLSVTGALARVAGRSTLLDRQKANELLAPHWVCSSAALARDAGWSARIPADAGLAETARWYRDQAWL